MTQTEYLEFLQKLKAQKDAENAKKRKIYQCVPCGKTFRSENAFKSHCESLKHQASVVAYQEQLSETQQINKNINNPTQSA